MKPFFALFLLIVCCEYCCSSSILNDYHDLTRFKRKKTTRKPTKPPIAGGNELDKLPKDCGKHKPIDINRIAGGKVSNAAEFPPYTYLKIMFGNNDVTCGGTIISNTHILTAAHCFDDYNDRRFDTVYVITGQDILSRSGGRGQEIKAKKVCKSRNYVVSTDTIRHDITVVKLSKPIAFNSHVQPACIPKTREVNNGKESWVIGMGKTGRVNFPKDLYALPVKKIHCPEIDKHETTICHESYDNRFIGDSCRGDSGGGVFSLDNNRLVVDGITSYGPEECQAGRNGKAVNANVHRLLKELNELLRECA